MDLSIPGSTTNSPLSTPSVFGDNVQDLLGTGALNVNPTGIIVVNSIADGVDDLNSGVTTLRDAINQANGDTGEDLIVFDRSLFSNPQTITLNQGELDLTHNLDMIAPRDSLTGADLVTVSGNNATRVFDIEKGADVHLDGLIVADGKVTGSGGGIVNRGSLSLDNSIVRNNSARGISIQYGKYEFIDYPSYGGGIDNSGTVLLSNSTVSGNSASGVIGYGGGISNDGIMNVSNSNLSSNWAGDGGGISNNKSGTMNVSNSTLSSNSVALSGSGISNDGIMNVRNSTISGNSAEFGGGGISNGGTMSVNNSTISGNLADNGGGILNGGTMNVNNSTISGNVVPRTSFSNATIGGNPTGTGGGIFNNDTMNVNNSTISGNSADTGGGIYNAYRGTVTLLFSTVTQNQAANGGGVYQNDVPLGPPFGLPSDPQSPGSASVRHTIIAANLNSANGVNSDVSGTFKSEGYNLIGDSTGSTGFDEAIGDIVGTSDNPIDPRLAPLDFNGGTTQTIALLPDSPAIDAGDPTMLDTDPTTDQRGFPRVSNGRADIGAFEFSS